MCAGILTPRRQNSTTNQKEHQVVTCFNHPDFESAPGKQVVDQIGGSHKAQPDHETGCQTTHDGGATHCGEQEGNKDSFDERSQDCPGFPFSKHRSRGFSRWLRRNPILRYIILIEKLDKNCTICRCEEAKGRRGSLLTIVRLLRSLGNAPSQRHTRLYEI